MKSYLSASGIKKHRRCPKQWWFRYVSDVEPVEGETKYLDLGNAVHEAIEAGLRQGRTDLAFVRTHYEHFATQYGVPDDLWDTGLSCIEVAVDFINDEDPEILDVEAEAEFQIDRPDLQETVVGKMDVATDTEIWDWKTGSIRDETPIEEKIQGATYMAAYRVKYGKPPEKIRFLYLKEEQKRSLDPTDEVWDTMLAHALKLARSKASGQFEATPGDVCDWCDYRRVCAEGGGIGANFDWEKWTAL